MKEPIEKTRTSGWFTEVTSPPAADDLSREVYGLFGMPIDALDRNMVVEQIKSAARAGRPFLISTPNLNFLRISRADPEFRESLLRSDLCAADGMPIVWLARLLGTPIKQRVSGSDLFETLKSKVSVSRPIKVFLFGGAEGVAKTVCQILNARSTGIQCVGWLNPGFGTIDQMSSDDIIAIMNQSSADLLAVFLNAQKAQSWLLRNHDRLKVPIRGQFGATINYQAGTIRRAPIILRHMGLEWLWRIKEEPYLWQRYWLDGLMLARLLVSAALPMALRRGWRHFVLRERSELAIGTREQSDALIVNLAGDASASNIAQSIACFRSALSQKQNIAVDISRMQSIDSRFFGLLLMVRKQLNKQGRALKFIGVSKRGRRSFRLSGFEFMLEG